MKKKKKIKFDEKTLTRSQSMDKFTIDLLCTNMPHVTETDTKIIIDFKNFCREEE